MDFSELTPAGIQNPRIKQYVSIKQNTKSNPDNLACLEGVWELSMARDARLPIRAFFVCPELIKSDTGRYLAEQIIATDAHSYVVSAKVMHRIADRDEPDGLAAIVQLPRGNWEDIPLREHNRIVVLDGLEIPGNVGTIIRCADSTGIDGVIVTNRRTRVSHPKLIHASMGSSFTMPIVESDIAGAVAWLKHNNFTIITTDTDAKVSYRKADYRMRVAVVMGSERYGIMREWYEAQDYSVAIPMHGKVDSLNVGNAAVLMLYEMFYQQEPERF
jgi:TrmH family RNA methyltransferase